MNGRRNCPIVPIEQVPPADTSAYRRLILVVDDELVIADTLTKILAASGYAAVPAYDAQEALEVALLTPPEMIITDVSLPGTSGIELAITIRRVFPDCKILLFSGHVATSDLLAAAKTAGHSFTLISKPVHPRDLLAHVAENFSSRENPLDVSLAS
jgi:CheY-like chemotaxis protein